MLIAADNIQITGKQIENALKYKNPEPVSAIVTECVQAGVDIIDINTGPLSRNSEADMTFFIETVQQSTTLPLMIDTANPVAMEAGLKSCRNPCIINGFSLEQKKLHTILPLAEKYDADIIGYLLNEDSSVPLNSDERLDIAVSLFKEAVNLGISQEKLIIDPVVVPLTWDNGTFQAMEVLQTLRLLPDLLGFPVRTIAGLSNLTTGSGPVHVKKRLEQAYVSMLSEAGLSIVLLNARHCGTIEMAKAGSMLRNTGIFSWENFSPSPKPA